MAVIGGLLWVLIVRGPGHADGGPVLARPVVTGLTLSCRPDPVLKVRVRSGNARSVEARATVSRNGSPVADRSRTAGPSDRKVAVAIGLGPAASQVLPSCKVPRGVAVTIRVTSRLGQVRKTAVRTIRGSNLRAVTTRRVELGAVGSPITESSGLVESRRHPGRFYTHDDSGGPASVFVLAEDGSVRATLPLAGVTNRDWEDIAIGPGPGGDAIFVGEIGDNSAVHDSVSVHRVPEPALSGVPHGSTLSAIEPSTAEFTYPDGPRDAEALVADPASGDLYLITKREDRARVYRAVDPDFDSPGPSELEFVRELDYTGVVAADACPDGETVLVKTYFGIYAHVSSEGIEQALAAPGASRLYLPDFSFPQDESVAADPWCSGYSVLPEGSGAPLARYVP
jgi:hypothetical protein